MTAASCSSCSATPTPQSLVLEALSKGEQPKKSGIASDDNDKRASKSAAASRADAVQISAAGYQQLQRDAAGETVVNPVAPVDVYNKTGLQVLPFNSLQTA
jgi:hypothetical protein